MIRKPDLTREEALEMAEKIKKMTKDAAYHMLLRESKVYTLNHEQFKWLLSHAQEGTAAENLPNIQQRFNARFNIKTPPKEPEDPEVQKILDAFGGEVIEEKEI